LYRHLALAIHISPNNGPIEMIPSAKLVVDVLAVHSTLQIMTMEQVLTTA
jgi:hypothetical protein